MKNLVYKIVIYTSLLKNRYFCLHNLFQNQNTLIMLMTYLILLLLSVLAKIWIGNKMQLGAELTEILVISLEQAVAAPYCGLLLANSGARVIKVERPEGDFARGYDKGAGGHSTIFAWLNSGKQSICLNFDKKADRNLLIKMLEKADVLLSNLAPGALEKRGLTGSVLRKRNPKLIHCNISGYGSDGVYSKKKAYDFLVQAESALCSVTGSSDAPSRVGISVTDLSTGLTAFSAILRALLQREKKGAGVDIDITMFDVMAEWMNMPLLAHRYFDTNQNNRGLTHSFIAPYGAFETGDGKKIVLSIQNNREWKIFCENILESPELVEHKKYKANTDRVKNKDSLQKIILNIFSKIDKETLVKKLDMARIANANLNSVSELSRHTLLNNKEIVIGNEKVKVAALPLQDKNINNHYAPNLDEDGMSIRNEFLG